MSSVGRNGFLDRDALAMPSIMCRYRSQIRLTNAGIEYFSYSCWTDGKSINILYFLKRTTIVTYLINIFDKFSVEHQRLLLSKSGKNMCLFARRFDLSISRLPWHNEYATF